MSDGIELNITQENLEQLRCSVCKDYLSCAPIRITSDGSNICGQCIPLDDTLTYRQFSLEAVLSDAVFPCRFKQNGCTTRLLFNHTLDHESKCIYRPVPCLSLPSTKCEWRGPVVEVPNHFSIVHADLVKQRAEFELNVDQDDQGFLMVIEGGAFVVKYLYDGHTGDLKYDIRCFKTPKKDSCKIRITNTLDPDFTYQLKGSRLLVFNHDLFNAQSAAVVQIKNFLKILSNPKTLTIAFTAMLGRSTENTVASKLAINYDVLESLKCKKCQYYLLPPIYDFEGCAVCKDCYDPDDCEPSSNEKLQILVSEQNFPCRWHGCEFIAKGDSIGSHQDGCKFRVYSCLSFNCNVTFQRSEATNHMASHGHRYFSDGMFVYKIRLNDHSIVNNYFFTIIDKEIVLVATSVSQYVHFLSLQTTKSTETQVTASVYFEHKHCKCKSDTFTFNCSYKLDICIDDLPNCFRAHQELTGYVKIL